MDESKFNCTYELAMNGPLSRTGRLCLLLIFLFDSFVSLSVDRLENFGKSIFFTSSIFLMGDFTVLRSERF